MAEAASTKKRYTYDDYLKTPDDERYELILEVDNGRWLMQKNIKMVKWEPLAKLPFVSFPNCLIGNPVLIKSIPYGCPIEAFGHDKLV